LGAGDIGGIDHDVVDPVRPEFAMDPETAEPRPIYRMVGGSGIMFPEMVHQDLNLGFLVDALKEQVLAVDRNVPAL
ncbi:hypothetical protein, partial [Sphingobacterium mizutaii]|uniref:hypothetical protein n=1 Tax=Sphingobacterium mizutaii TaxID=1010 RepID=UPI00289FA2CE